MKEFVGRRLEASDGAIGKIEDVYFDDRHWRVRYVVVDSESWLGKKVLLSPEAFRSGPSTGEGKKIATMLTRERIRQSPFLGSELPTRDEQIRLHNYYNWVHYWTEEQLYGPAANTNEIPGHLQNDPAHPQPATIETAAGSVPAASMNIPPAGTSTDAGPAPAASASSLSRTTATETATEPVTEPVTEEEARAIGLQSLRKMLGYHLQATDGEIGHVDGFVVDDDWYIRYAQVDTSNGLGGKTVLVPSEWLPRIDWAKKKVHVDMDRQTLKNSPAYDPGHLNRDYETQLYEYHRRPGYWRAA